MLLVKDFMSSFRPLVPDLGQRVHFGEIRTGDITPLTLPQVVEHR